jgi:hypothetical protein
VAPALQTKYSDILKTGNLLKKGQGGVVDAPQDKYLPPIEKALEPIAIDGAQGSSYTDQGSVKELNRDPKVDFTKEKGSTEGSVGTLSAFKGYK